MPRCGQQLSRPRLWCPTSRVARFGGAGVDALEQDSGHRTPGLPLVGGSGAPMGLASGRAVAASGSSANSSDGADRDQQDPETRQCASPGWWALSELGHWRPPADQVR